MRRAPAAVLLALLLTVAAGLVPAVAPWAPLTAALGPAVALAADDVSIATATRYTVVPKAGRVRVVVDITATNEKPNKVVGGTVTRYFYDGVNLAIQPEARTVRATQDGSPIKVDLASRKGYRLATILFRENLYYQQTARVRLTFDLPGERHGPPATSASGRRSRRSRPGPSATVGRCASRCPPGSGWRSWAGTWNRGRMPRGCRSGPRPRRGHSTGTRG